MSSNYYDQPRPRSRHTGREPKYPWYEWSQPGKHTVTQGIDFDCSPRAFVAQLHNKLHMRTRPKGFPDRPITYCETSVDGDTVTFEYHYVEFESGERKDYD